jgi:deazaflavin-dependent oxidoreductase (nitroreductase family)
MVRKVMVAAAGLATAVLVVFFVGMRKKSPLVLDTVRRVNRTVFNPRQMRSAGAPGAYAAVIHHVGRTSGRPYATPVVATATDDGFVVALPYVERADWVRNVLAAGAATVDHEGGTYEVHRPELVPMAEAETLFVPEEQRAHRMFAVDQCLLLRRADAPGIAGNGDRGATGP